MNILITGVHGFVGSNLVKALSPENTIMVWTLWLQRRTV